MCRSLRALTADAVRFNLSFELLIVDWNSNQTLPSVADSLRASCVLFLPLRIIIVPPSIHASFPNPASATIMLLAAKNAAARRARGTFIVFTNADDVYVRDCRLLPVNFCNILNMFPPKLLLQLTAATLRQGRVYRAMRWEIHAATQVV
jgi:hypothetical protein